MGVLGTCGAPFGVPLRGLWGFLRGSCKGRFGSLGLGVLG